MAKENSLKYFKSVAGNLISSKGLKIRFASPVIAVSEESPQFPVLKRANSVTEIEEDEARELAPHLFPEDKKAKEKKEDKKAKEGEDQGAAQDGEGQDDPETAPKTAEAAAEKAAAKPKK